MHRVLFFLVLAVGIVCGFFFGAGAVRHHIVPPFSFDNLSESIPFLPKRSQVPLVDEHLQLSKDTSVPRASRE